MKQTLLLLALVFAFISCDNDKHHKSKDHDYDTEEKHSKRKDHHPKKSIAQVKKELKEDGYEIFDYVDEKTKDTVIMQQYFIAFLKSGPNRSQGEEEANKLQEAHLAHLGKMYEMGYADISGPFGDDGDIRGITIYNVPTLKMADSLANADPAVKAGRLVIEVHPWWAAKGFPLR